MTTMENGAPSPSGSQQRQPLHLDISSLTPPSSGTARSRARSISQALPSLRISTTPTAVSPPALLSAGVSSRNKAPGEPRNLLAHLLSRLLARPRAPSVYDELRTAPAKKDSHRLGVVVETVRSAIRLKGAREFSEPQTADRVAEDDGTLENEQGFSTDATYDYMVQLRDILILSDKLDWQILDATDADAVTSQQESSSLRRLRRASPQLGQRSRSPSPSGSPQSPGLLHECISILASVVSEDCRFRTSNARLTRPPYSLQGVCLDIAQILVKTHCHDAKILSMIGFAVIPAFASFDSALHTRLLAFFEDVILRGMLEDLQSLQGPRLSHVKDHITDTIPEKAPIVAIQVDEAADDPEVSGRQGWSEWPSATSATSNFLSTVAPSQPLTIYYLSSLIPPLLAAVFEAIDPFEDVISNIPRLHRFHTLLHTIVSMKQDAYLDVLEIVAYNGALTRRKAMAVLGTFWPKALGHIVIGKPLPVVGYSDTLSNQSYSKLQFARPNRDHPYAHEFMPWRFSHSGSSSLDYGVLRNCCQSCSTPIIDFGLLCPFCCVCVHVNCYDTQDGTFHGQYLSPSETDPRPYFLSFSNILPPRKDYEPHITRKAEHSFRLANLFSLALCLVCHKPLWGYVMQGLKCTGCHQFVHSTCMVADLDVFPRCEASSLPSGNVFIDWSVLRETFVEHYRQILLTEADLNKRNYEEISIYYSVLWAQHRILDNGISYRSIIVSQKDPKVLMKENFLDDFELQYFVRLYEAYLSSNRLTISAALQEYLEFNKLARPNEHCILFDWSLLCSVTSFIKMPSSSHPPPLSTPSNLLHVADQEVAEPVEATLHPFETVRLSHLRDALGHEFHVYSDIAAHYMLSHIHQAGFFDRIDASRELFDGLAPSDVLCSFPLPSGLDLSTSVETLVVAIDACLQDIDITINEYGFLLLVRRFASTGAASEYALSRLTKMVLSWIFAEDDRLVVIAREHVAHKRSLPGVRSASDPFPWPITPTSRYNTQTTPNSGGEYVSCRKQLLARHAMPWLFSVHELDATLYTNYLYGYCVDVAEMSQNVADSLYLSRTESKVKQVQKNQESSLNSGEVMLRSIIKLAQANVTFSSFESILIKWFDFVTRPGFSPRPASFKSLPRLFNYDASSSRRTSTIYDGGLALPESVHIDPWKVFVDVASQGIDGLERSILWLRVMAYSAVDIPAQTFKQLFTLAGDFRAPLTTTVSLLESTMCSTWLKSFRNDGLNDTMVQTNVIWIDDLLFRMQSENDSGEILDFLRYSLVTCLLVYGCDREAIVSLGLISSDSLQYIPQRRRTATRSSAAPAVLKIDPQLVTMLSRYVTEGPEPVCAIVAKFLHVLTCESALLDSHEIDQFILLNGDALAQCAWRFYDVDLPEISNIRITFLLRILVVDSQPLDALLRGFLQVTGKWQIRFQAVTRLFRILLGVTSPYFGVPDRQWRTSVADVFRHFFSSLWKDDREEIRLAVDTWANTLLPPHLWAISACWNEYMSKAPVVDRSRMASFLVQLHPHFPSWKVLSWETLVESLLDDDLVQNNGAVEDGYAAAAHLSVYGYPSTAAGEGKLSRRDDPEVVSLRISLVILSLQLLADGVQIDMVNLLKLKLILAKVLGFTKANLQPTPNGQTFHVQFEELHKMHEVSYTCINPLMRVLDAPHPLTLSPSSMGVMWSDSPVPGLLGDIFVDLAAKLWDNVENVRVLPYSALRGLLESMVLIIVKHELNNAPLKHLDELMCKAVKTVTDLISLDTNYDVRHLCLAVMRAFMKAYPVLALKILGHQVLVLTRLAASLQFNTEDSLVVEARVFLEAAFSQYEVSGLFWLLSKQGRMSDDLFVMIRQVVNGSTTPTTIEGEFLRDSIVRDTLSKAAANTSDRAIPDILHNLERYVAICHHQSFPISLIQHIGLRLTAIARQTADAVVTSSARAGSSFDPNPLLLMAATIVQHNKSQSVDLLLHTETLLRAALVRFEVHFGTLSRLLQVTSTIYRRSKTADINGAEVPPNHIAMGVLDILSDSLKGKVRALPSTVTVMIEAVVSLHDDENSYLPTSAVLRACSDAAPYLSNLTYRETYGQVEFASSLAVVKLVLHASTHVDTFLMQSLVGQTRSSTPVRVWNLVALGILTSPVPAVAQRLLMLLPHFVMDYISLLRVPLSGVLDDSAALIVNHAFASVKLWMLIARNSCIHDAVETPNLDNVERMVWNELWPSFEKLLVQSLSDGPNAEKPPLMTVIWGCILDLILFVRQARSVVALDTSSSHMSILDKLRIFSHGEVAGGKFARAQRSISEPPADISNEALVSQVSNDVFTAEKLQSVEVYRQGGLDRRRENARRDT